MENFFDEEAIANLYQESSSAISTARMLLLMCVLIMVDRTSCIFPLLQYVLSDGKSFKDGLF